MANVILKSRFNTNDECYTQYKDIENEVTQYKSQFNNKIVYCNCDHPLHSNFVKFFIQNFNEFHLKKLYVTCYSGMLKDFNDEPWFGEVNYVDKVENVWNDNLLITLKGDGDFRSLECIEILKQSDIVVTNPPFSLLYEFIPILIKYEKEFLVLANQNAIINSTIFPLILNKKMTFGYHFGKMIFNTKTDKTFELGNTCWFTNLNVSKTYPELNLYKHYSPEEYPNFDNFRAINVDNIHDIPIDYDGIMGVPITCLLKLNPEEFELVGISVKCLCDERFIIPNKSFKHPLVNGKAKYQRIFIQKKKAPHNRIDCTTPE